MRTEITFALLIVAALIMKFMHWPGGGFFLVITCTVLAVLYWPGAYYFFCDKVIKRQNLGLSIAAGLVLSSVPVGLLFKMQIWPGASYFLLFGTIGSVVALAAVLFFRRKSREQLRVYYQNMLKRTIVLSVVATAFYFLPTASIIRALHRDNPELARLMVLRYNNPENEEYKKQYKAYRAQQDSVFFTPAPH